MSGFWYDFHFRLRVSSTFSDFSVPVDRLSASRLLRVIQTLVTRLASSPAVCSGLQTTPADFAQQCILAAYHPVPGIPIYSVFFGSFLGRQCLSTSPASFLEFPPERLPVLSRLSTRLHGLCSREHPDCIGPGYRVDGMITPRPALVCRLPLCLRFTVRQS